MVCCWYSIASLFNRILECACARRRPCAPPEWFLASPDHHVTHGGSCGILGVYTFLFRSWWHSAVVCAIRTSAFTLSPQHICCIYYTKIIWEYCNCHPSICFLSLLGDGVSVCYGQLACMCVFGPWERAGLPGETSWQTQGAHAKFDPDIEPASASLKDHGRCWELHQQLVAFSILPNISA